MNNGIVYAPYISVEAIQPIDYTPTKMVNSRYSYSCVNLNNYQTIKVKTKREIRIEKIEKILSE